MEKMKFYVKSMIYWCFTFVIEYPCVLIFFLRKGLCLYKEDPNIILDEYLRNKHARRLTEEFVSNTKIGRFGDDLCYWLYD